ncbi:beta-N-acetylglucosaminidase domain-containing protein [Mangrovibacterium marinum]|nr:beta-N-acetylglucosaminidase domain-containing protein [Mangrovibacterium marinum]
MLLPLQNSTTVEVKRANTILRQVYPIPQQMIQSEELIISRKGETNWHQSQQVAASTKQQLKKLIDGYNLEIRILLGEEAQEAYPKQLPKVPESYVLHVSKAGISIAANDQTGIFYAVQSLRQLVRRQAEELSLPITDLTDWPDVPFRGTVEGFYGKPWSHAARLAQLDFYGRNKLNTYIYGPKDDPYHGFSTQWREPYPAQKAVQISELAEKARQNQVNFVWAVHPGRDIHWTDNDHDGLIDDFVACLHKFELMYKLGIRSFAVFFDDISGEGTDANRQAELMNYLNANFVRKKPDVTPLIMCPTQYNRAWSSGDYLTILGDKLDQDIAIMWTGNSVCADITREGLDWINRQIKRKAFIWWNWPVSDYVRTRLLLGPAYGLDVNNKGTLSGFVSNPMDKPEASKIGLFGVADYCWNMHGYKSQSSWEAGIRYLFPELWSEMQLFAEHNSDQGPNSHGYRREESARIQPYTQKALAEWTSNQRISGSVLDTLSNEFRTIAGAAEILLTRLPEINPALHEELEYWLACFESLGIAGEAALQLGSAELSEDQLFALSNQVFAQFRNMEHYSFLQKQKGAPDRWAQGCVSGGTVLMPFIEQLFEQTAPVQLPRLTGQTAGLPQKAAEESYRFLSSVKSLQSAPVIREGKFVRIQPMLEVIKLAPGDYIGIVLPQGIYANYIHLELENEQACLLGEVQVSSNGTDWQKHEMQCEGSELQNRISVDEKRRYVRFQNKSDKTLELKINRFKVDIPENSRINSKQALSDGDLFSYYEFSASTTEYRMQCPDEKSGRQVRIVGETSGIQLVFTDGARAAYDETPQPTSKNIRSIAVETHNKPVRIHEIIWE